MNLKGIFGGSLPDVTPAQVMAVLGWVGSQAVAWGAINSATEQHYISILGTTVSGLVLAADVLIRKHRAENMDKIVSSKANTTVSYATGGIVPPTSGGSSSTFSVVPPTPAAPSASAKKKPAPKT